MADCSSGPNINTHIALTDYNIGCRRCGLRTEVRSKDDRTVMQVAGLLKCVRCGERRHWSWKSPQ